MKNNSLKRTTLWVIAALLVAAGIWQIASDDHDWIWGALLILAGCAVGPGGDWAVFGRGRR